MKTIVGMSLWNENNVKKSVAVMKGGEFAYENNISFHSRSCVATNRTG